MIQIVCSFSVSVVSVDGCSCNPTGEWNRPFWIVWTKSRIWWSKAPSKRTRYKMIPSIMMSRVSSGAIEFMNIQQPTKTSYIWMSGFGYKVSPLIVPRLLPGKSTRPRDTARPLARALGMEVQMPCDKEGQRHIVSHSDGWTSWLQTLRQCSS